ncbi:hypothetical protein RI367_006045 [Sorochytrium milnesiophthora]
MSSNENDMVIADEDAPVDTRALGLEDDDEVDPDAAADAAAELGKIDESLLINPCDKTVQQLNDDDMQMLRAVDMLFQNDYKAAAEFLEPKSDKDSLYMTGLGVLGLMKAMSTFKPEDITAATKQLQRAAAMAAIQQKLATPKSTSYRLTRWITGSAKFIAQTTGIQELPMLNYGQLRSTITKAEAGLLVSLMLLFQESVLSFVRASWNLRQSQKCFNHAWHTYQKLFKEDPNSVAANIDKHTMGGIQFGIGALNVVLSILPQKVLRVISVFGLSADRESGFDLLDKAIQSNGVRAPVAEMFVSAFHSITSSFAPTILGPSVVPPAIRYLQQGLNRYPNSAFHLMLMGRTCRTARDLQLANEFLVKSRASQDEWKELQLLCDYELAMNGLMQLNWQYSATLFTTLKTASYWSNAFFSFAEASCLAMLESDQASTAPAATTPEKDTFTAEAADDVKVAKPKATTPEQPSRAVFLSAPGWVKRKYGGKTISVEQYVIRKVKLFERTNFRHTLLPGLELIYLWNGYTSMSKPHLEQAKLLVERTMAQYQHEIDQYRSSAAGSQHLHSKPKKKRASKLNLHHKKKGTNNEASGNSKPPSRSQSQSSNLTHSSSSSSLSQTNRPASDDAGVDDEGNDSEVNLDFSLDEQAQVEEADVFEDRLGVLKLIHAAIDKELGNLDAAVAELDWILERDKQFHEESWVPAFACYQMGVTTFSRLVRAAATSEESKNKTATQQELDNEVALELMKETKSWFVRARDKYSEYNFEFRLALRIHLALLQLSRWIDEEVVPDLTQPDAKVLINLYKTQA